MVPAAGVGTGAEAVEVHRLAPGEACFHVRYRDGEWATLTKAVCGSAGGIARLGSLQALERSSRSRKRPRSLDVIDLSKEESPEPNRGEQDVQMDEEDNEDVDLRVILAEFGVSADSEGAGRGDGWRSSAVGWRRSIRRRERSPVVF